MKRRNFIQASLGLGIWPMAVTAQHQAMIWRDITFTGLGTVLTLRAAHVDAKALDFALQRARKVIERIEDEMSLFRPDSALSRFNASGVLIRPSADLLKILRISQYLAKRSHGAFDVTVQPLWQLYAQAQKEGRLPAADEVDQARKKVGWQRLLVTADRLAFAQPDMGVSLNGIAQGYAADQVRASLVRDGVAHALINTGEWAAIGLAEGKRPWMLGIADPHRADHWLTRVTMQGWSLATSADDQCMFSADRKHHHIFDPHTGYSPYDIASVSVAAPTCTVADALTKVLFVGGYDRAMHLAKAWGVLALVVHKNGNWIASDNFPHAAG